MSRAIYGVMTALCVAGLLAALPTTVSSSGAKTIKLTDECDPATFNAVLGPGACVGDGDVTFNQFVAEFLATGQVEDWEFDPDHDHVNSGKAIRAENEGGETHTFTEVAAFGGGFVPILNDLSGNPVPAPECFTTTAFVPPDGQLDVGALSPGTHMFQCCIHPWMRTTIKVRNHD